MILLDTDVMIDVLRRYLPAVAWLESLGNEEIRLSGFVVMELLQGCRNKAEQEKLEKVLQSHAITWPPRKPAMRPDWCLPMPISATDSGSWMH